ncbi:toll-like receptor 5 [Protopterus annectens]|uniref:toll-like receptor 5 n=1 Tax=Protopterus annectens TaxID=7888 RepID=UPI001CFC0BC6|nr:toll-like receptor 5 [Protopterus annectens]
MCDRDCISRGLFFLLLWSPLFLIDAYCVDRGNGVVRCFTETRIPDVPSDTVGIDLNVNNYISSVTESSFRIPLLNLSFLLLGLQKGETPLFVGAGAFRNVPNIQYLDLGGNGLIQLDPDAFIGLRKLQTLYLDVNGLGDSILQERYFRELISLQKLVLDGNRISSVIPHDSFRNLSFLSHLSLKLNQISHIRGDHLNNFRGIRFALFDISSNHLNRGHWDWGGNPFRDIAFDILDLSSNELSSVNLQKLLSFIWGTDIYHLKLTDLILGSLFGYHNIAGPDNETLSGLNNSELIILDLSLCSIFSLVPHLFSHLHTLKLLSLYKNNINQIDPGAFMGLDTLQVLNLSSNMLRAIHKSDFDGLWNVGYIDLQQNHIGIIDVGTFSNLKHLFTVDLRDNVLSTLLLEPHVTNFYLGGNRMEVLNIPENNNKTSILDLSENRLEDLSLLYSLIKMPMLESVVLRNNNLKRCSFDGIISPLNQLKHLELSHNFLWIAWDSGQCLKIFHNLTKLEILYLDNNFLLHLPHGIFNGLISLRYLNLSFNSLSYVSTDVFPQTLEVLSLSNNRLVSPNPDAFKYVKFFGIMENPLACDCHLKPFIDWLIGLNLTLNEYLLEIKCAWPPEFQDISVIYLNTSDCIIEDGKNLELIKFSMFASFASLLTLFVTSLILYNHYRGICFMWYKKLTEKLLYGPKQDSDGFLYDAYVCFTGKDIQWVQNAILQHLDFQFCDKNKFSMCFEARDFIPGEDHVTNIRNAIWNSRKTLCIVTRSFLKDGMCIEAFNIAYGRLFSELKDVIVFLVVGGIPEYELMKNKMLRAFIKSKYYWRWPEDPQDHSWILDRIAHQLVQRVQVSHLSTKKTFSLFTLLSIARRSKKR